MKFSTRYSRPSSKRTCRSIKSPRAASIEAPWGAYWIWGSAMNISAAKRRRACASAAGLSAAIGSIRLPAATNRTEPQESRLKDALVPVLLGFEVRERTGVVIRVHQFDVFRQIHHIEGVVRGDHDAQGAFDRRRAIVVFHAVLGTIEGAHIGAAAHVVQGHV